MKRIALLNQKGGSGKTTSAVNLGAALARKGKAVLLVDLDPQAHLTYSLGLEPLEGKTIYEVLKGEETLAGILLEREGIKVAPSSIALSAAEIELSGLPGREFLLREALSKVRGFQFLLIDCPPSLGLLTLNALTTAEEVYIPLQTEFLALQGVSKLMETVEVVRRRLNSGLSIAGIIGTRYDGRKNLNREVVERIKAHFGNKVFRTLIRDNIALAEAPSHGKTIFEYRPDSNGAEDYMALCEEILRRG